MGAVSVVRHRSTGQQYALKTIQLNRISDQFIKELRNEIEILRRLDHPHIVRAFDVFESKRRVFLILELCTGGDLTSRGPQPEPRAARIASEIVSSVACMHSQGICHRDLKMENILFEDSSPESHVKLIDFGLSKIYLKGSKKLKGMTGTLYSMAPEVMNGCFYDESCDMWSVGVLVYILLSGCMPFDCRSRECLEQSLNVGQYSLQGRAWAGKSDLARSFIRSLIAKDPKKRLTAMAAMQHPWIQMHLKGSISSHLCVAAGGADAVNSPIAPGAVARSMKHYAAYNKLKKLALMAIAHRSDVREIQSLRDAFVVYDASGEGTISLKEFRTVLASQGYSPEDIFQLFQGVDEDHDGLIHYSEFLAATIETMGVLEEERLADAFDLLDSDGSKEITKENLRQLLGKDAVHYDLEAIMASVDKNNSGGCTFEEFKQLMSSERKSPVLAESTVPTEASSCGSEMLQQ
jgi:calcium-dependent protein kinase